MLRRLAFRAVAFLAALLATVMQGSADWKSEMVAYTEAALTAEGRLRAKPDGKCDPETASAIQQYLGYALLPQDQTDTTSKDGCDETSIDKAFLELEKRHGRTIADELGFRVIELTDVLLIEEGCPTSNFPTARLQDEMLSVILAGMKKMHDKLGPDPRSTEMKADLRCYATVLDAPLPTSQ